MSKKILAVLFLLIILAIGGQSAFWFFKTSQLEKQLANYSKSDNVISIDRFEISGFPLKQNVSINNLKIKIPENIAQKNEVIFQKVNLSSSIFGDIFNVDFAGIAILKTNNIINNIEFDQTPAATLQVTTDGVKKFIYNDKGYRIFGPDKNLLTRSGPNNLQFTSNKTASGQIVSRVRASSNNTENFDLASIYKNRYEEKIIDGIKTGQIQIGLKELEQEEQALAQEDQAQSLEESSKESNQFSLTSINDKFEKDMKAKVNAEAEAKAQAAIAAANPEVAASAKTELAEVKETELVPEPLNEVATNEEQDQNPEDPTEENDQLAVLEDMEEEVMKSTIIIDVEYVLTPVQSDNGQVTDPTKIAQIVTKYNKSYKINKLEISNDKFKISINGQLDEDRDDTNISGFATLKVDKVNNFVEYVKTSFAKIAENDSQIKSFDPSYNSPIVKNGYSSFLSVVSDKLSEVMGELSAKNQLSQNDSAVFDIRREKNLDIVINETPMREIVGKF